ncbi:MAG: metal-sensing transcriptional repressor [Eggerthellaceae bacterium]
MNKTNASHEGRCCVSPSFSVEGNAASFRLSEQHDEAPSEMDRCANASSPREGLEKKTCDCRYKETERAEQFQADVQKRLNRAIGQLNGVKGMIDDNRYCGDVLTQLAAAESAIRSAAEMILRDHLETCVKDRIRRGDDEVIDEAMRLIKKFARS